jgi:uncharacterized protein (TIGR02678 family)
METLPDGIEVEERRRAIGALLRGPLMVSGGQKDLDFALVRKHGAWLKEWFFRYCGWALAVETELARLRKTPGNMQDATRALVDSQGEAFTRRRYVVLCLALAALEKSEQQTVLRRLAEDVAGEFASDPELMATGMVFDLKERECRRDLVEVVRHLMALKVIINIDGDEQQYLSNGERDVLYNINRAALSAMLNVRRGPSTIRAEGFDARVTEMADEVFPETEEGRNRQIRLGLFRKLMDDPVVYYETLSDAERAYFVSQRGSIVREIEAATGMIQEARREGVAMTDPFDTLSDVRMPEEGTDGHSTLLIAEFLAKRLRAGKAEPVGFEALEKRMDELIKEHEAHWRKGVTEPGGAVVLLEGVLIKLEALGLAVVDREARVVSAKPAIGRYAVGELKVKARKNRGEEALWNGQEN